MSRTNRILFSARTALGYTPHHEENGNFVKANGTTVKLCDCLRISCPGCHVPCRQCGSRMCGPACQKGRDFVPLVVGCKCDPTPPIYHPFLEKEEKCDCPCHSSDL
ncbi:unnamed protein product [Toxocara canis]|nr:unnamed protein product [Toxocara canis]